MADNQHIGRFQEIGVAMEDTRGTAESSPDHSIQKGEANFIKSVEKDVDERTRATVADSQTVRKVSELVEGDLSMDLHADVAGYLLANIFGSVSSAEQSTGAYLHEFTVAEDITRPTLSVFYKEGDVEQGVVPGCVIDTLTISGEADGVVEAEFDITGTTDETSSASFSYSAESDFVGRDVKVSKASSVSGLSSAEYLDVQEFDIEIDTDPETQYVMDGNFYPAENYQKSMIISGSFVINFKDTTWKDLYDSDDDTALLVKIESEKTIGSSDNPKVAFELPEVYVEDWDRDSGASDVITQEVSWKAVYNAGEGTIAYADVLNETSSYELSS